MSWKPITIDDSVTRTSSGSVHVREGQYLFAFNNIIPSKQEYDGDGYYMFELVFREGPDPTALGNKISFVATFKEDSQFGLGTIAQAMGINPESLKGRTFATYEQWVQFGAALAKALKDKNALVGGTVIDRSYNGRISSRVDKVWPAADWETRKSAAVLPSSSNGSQAMAPVPAGADDAFMDDVTKMFGPQA